MAEIDRKNEAEFYFKKAYEFQVSGELSLAEEYYKKAIAIHPTAEAHTFLGWTYSFMKRLEDAIEECKKAIEVDPNFGNPYNDIGAYLIEIGKSDEAVEWLEKAKKASRYEPRHFPYYNLARIYKQKYMIKEAIGELEEAVKLEPEYTLAVSELKKLRSQMN